MRSRLLTAGLASTLLLSAATALAQLPTPSVTQRPAATLLLPYFEVDLANPAGENTIITVSNAAATATLTHVTVWSTMHVPVFSFDLYLTGYDVQRLLVRDILAGALPATAAAAQDPADTISPNSGHPGQDGNFTGCAGLLPAAAVPQATINHMRAALVGQASPLMPGMCAAKPDGTNVARGYITVDATNSCTTLTPRDAGYFISGGLGIASNKNALFGDYVLTNHIGGVEASDGGPLVHIFADATDPQMNVAGQYTFYGRLVNWTAADNREPLSTSFMTRFSLSGAFASTSLIVWRDSKVNQNYFACGSTPTWYPLNQRQVVMFDEQENPVAGFGTFAPFGPQPPVDSSLAFPSAAQRVRVGGASLPVTSNFGFMFLNLATVVTGSEANPPDDVGVPNKQTTQAWVITSLKGGRYTVGWGAVAMDSAKATNASTVGF